MREWAESTSALVKPEVQAVHDSNSGKLVLTLLNYPATAVPGKVNSRTWQYAGNAQGSLTLNTANLASGNYVVWFLYNDAYTELTSPIGLMIV